MRSFLLLLTTLVISACSVADTADVEETAETAADGPLRPFDAPTTSKMTGEGLAAIIRELDADADVQGNGILFEVAEREMVVVFDETAGRMRIVAPILPAGILDEDILMRMAQANYDAALDARYAVANGQVLAVFIHPLDSLTREDFVSGLGQVYTAAETFGTTYTSGAMVFGGGDTTGLLDELRKQLEEAAIPDPI